MKKYRLPITLLLLIIMTSTGVLVGRSFHESKKFYNKGRKSLFRNEPQAAVMYFGRAVQWYVPGNPFVGRSINTLVDVGREAESGGDVDAALETYYTLRGALKSIRWLDLPFRETVEYCNERIVELTMRKHPHTDKKRVISHLKHDSSPDTAMAFFTILGFWGWVLSTLGLIWGGFNAEGKPAAKRSLFWGAATLTFFLLWIFGMIRA